MTIEITKNSTNGIVIWDPLFEKATVTNAAADVMPAGTILGRVAATGNMVPFVAGSSNGSQIPTAVLGENLDFTAGAGDLPMQVLISGRVRLEDLIVAATGNPPTAAQADLLRSATIIAQTTTQLSQFDNE